ncbi:MULTISPECIES: hypothetical protein [Vibrio]|uniref:DUF4194 domain-containing protein n=1 Tax=Vibrio kanaloae TaxID=170673 RepID=A0ABV4L993_9VIBR|nr:hypothetical protein [Vibrio kanaloae]OEF15400.1 hypothetical protein A132_16160 [Vibrio kanaloae 5S-149]UIJ43230.1 hypothetical protein LWM38_16505 [Vibrio kanaloae]
MSLNNDFYFLDVFNEHSITLYRVLIIIDKLQYNRLKRKVLTLDKLCFFDSVIVDKNLTESVIRYFKPKETNYYYEGVDYLSNTSQTLKNVMRNDQVRRRVMELYSIGLIDIHTDDDDILLTTREEVNIELDNDLIDEWISNLDKTKSFISKSFNQLIGSLIGELYE